MSNFLLIFIYKKLYLINFYNKKKNTPPFFKNIYNSSYFIFRKLSFSFKKEKSTEIFDLATFLLGKINSGFSIYQALNEYKKINHYERIKLTFLIDKIIITNSIGYPLSTAIEKTIKNVKKDSDIHRFFRQLGRSYDTGSDPKTILRNTIETIKKRTALENKILTLTAQIRFQALLIGFSPLFVGILIYLISPDHISLFFSDPIGQKMLVVIIIMNVLGGISIHRLMKINGI